MNHLDKIDNSCDLKKLDETQLTELAEEIRQEIISIVAETGGHLSSNLGAVELTLALHYCFDIPNDKIVWDVGHQCYIHKMLTGRREQMKMLRQYDGPAGFPKREESPADPFGSGHASTSISAALGLAAARDNLGLHHKVVAVVGDGALTGGLSYEGLNNAGAAKKDLLVILNDNKMSISSNVGAISKYLTNIMADQRFNKLRNQIWELTGRFKRRDKIRAVVSDIEDSVKGLFVPGFLFDKLGFRYFGPIDGHNLPLLIKTVNHIKDLPGPIMLHVVTVKGKGYPPAEADATKFHGVGSFDKITGKTRPSQGLPPYTNIFGETMLELAQNNPRIIAITAAMTAGTGLSKFAEKYPDRFYDVGIAEAHASCFAAGLAAGGARPFVAIYSTFLQRAYDQIIHDIALQKLPVVFCVDRAGLVGEDGPTHHGCFDLSFLSAVPNLTIMAPKDGDELRSMLHLLAESELDGPCVVRYPRAAIPSPMTNALEPIEWGKWELLHGEGETAVIAVGTMVETALKAHEVLKGEKEFAIVNARFIKPLDIDFLNYCMDTYKSIITIEENSAVGGLGQMVGSYLEANGFKGRFLSFAIPDNFIHHGHRNKLLAEIGLDTDTLVEALRKIDSVKRTFLQKITFRKIDYRKSQALTGEPAANGTSGKHYIK
ncbi:MAG: 1-deoxy-D-xylulose-5-phosphate synthase [candidate division Zixibacteria bacterium]|nr:1-deoxy-D-xylulose-5-phosphate synthase [candidate division Zixibacteria bacterium]